MYFLKLYKNKFFHFFSILPLMSKILQKVIQDQFSIHRKRFVLIYFVDFTNSASANRTFLGSYKLEKKIFRKKVCKTYFAKAYDCLSHLLLTVKRLVVRTEIGLIQLIFSWFDSNKELKADFTYRFPSRLLHVPS